MARDGPADPLEGGIPVSTFLPGFSYCEGQASEEKSLASLEHSQVETRP